VLLTAWATIAVPVPVNAYVAELDPLPVMLALAENEPPAFGVKVPVNVTVPPFAAIDVLDKLPKENWPGFVPVLAPIAKVVIADAPLLVMVKVVAAEVEFWQVVAKAVVPLMASAGDVVKVTSDGP